MIEREELSLYRTLTVKKRDFHFLLSLAAEPLICYNQRECIHAAFSCQPGTLRKDAAKTGKGVFL